ncbi:uncharacterized protein LOC144932906 [Lampetra fluviatilis]
MEVVLVLGAMEVVLVLGAMEVVLVPGAMEVALVLGATVELEGWAGSEVDTGISVVKEDRAKTRMAMEERASLKMVAFMEEILMVTTCQTTVGLDTLEEKLSRRDLAGWVGESCESLAADITLLHDMHLTHTQADLHRHELQVVCPS